MDGCVHDLLLAHRQAVRPTGPLRRRQLPAQPRREGGPGRPQRRRQDDALPDDRRRGGRRRGRRLGAEAAVDRLLPPGRRGDGRTFGARRGHRRQRPGRRPAPRARAAAARHVGSGQGRRSGPHPGPLRGSAGGVRPPRRLRARGAGARDPARPRLRRRAHRRRRRRAVGRLEDAGGDGPGAARTSRRAADGRADQPPRHRVDHLARGLPEGPARRPAHDLARPRVHEPHRDEDRRDRRRRDHRLLGQLRLLREGAGHPRGQPRGRLRPPAGDAGQGAALHRPLRRPRRQGGAGAEPGQGAGEDREDRAAQAPPGGPVRLPAAAALGRSGGGARGRAQGLRQARGPRRDGHDHPPRRALVRDGEERRRQVDACSR